MAEKREVIMQLRLSQNEWDMMKGAAAARGMTSAGFARWALVNESRRPTIDAWQIQRGDRERAIQCVRDPSTPHYRLDPIETRSREVITRVHAWYAQGSYSLVRSLAHIADRGFVRDRENTRLFLRGSGTYKVVNTLELGQAPETVMVVFLELEEPAPL